jgi:putative hydrolase of the HAD superfamily
MIRAALFDLDGTLFDRDTSVRTLIARQYDAFAAALGHVPKDSFIARFMELDERGYVRKDIVYRQLVTEFQIDRAHAGQLYDHFFATYHSCCAPFPNLHAALTRLQALGLRLGIITNGGHIFQMRTVAALGIEPYFAAILTSEGEQLKKPDARLFQRALERLEVPATAAVFVGDHPLVDVGGARDAGLRAIWKRDPFWGPPAYADGVIDDLSELEDCVCRMM